MKKNSCYPTLKKIAEKASLFETAQEADSFLQETLREVMEQAGSSLGAVFLYNERARELEFRVGYDREDFWDSCRCEGKKVPRNFALEGNEVGKAFSEGSIRVINYEESSPYPLHSKILIPISRGPEKIGVLLIAHQDSGYFDNMDREDLQLSVSLLGDILAEAMALLENQGCSCPAFLRPF